MGLLIRKHRELISVVVPGYGDGPPRFGSSTRVGQRPRGWSDAGQQCYTRERPVLHPFRYVAELRPTAPGNDQGIASGRGAAEDTWVAFDGSGVSPVAGAATSQHAPAHPWGKPTRTNSDDPAACFVCEVPLDGSMGLTQGPLLAR